MEMLRERLILALAALTAVMILSHPCAYAAKPTGITISAQKATTVIGRTITLKATVTPSRAEKKVIWKSSDSKVASVSSKGLVTAKKAGEATITVYARANANLKAICRVTVRKKNAMDYKPAKGTFNARKASVYGSKLNQTEMRKLKTAVSGVIRTVIKPQMKDYQKFNAIAKWLTGKTRYEDWQKNRYNNTAYGPIIRGKGACSGYARALKALCDAAGLPCYYVHAANASHQWNMVRLDGIWFVFDAQAFDYMSGYAAGGVDYLPGLPFSYYRMLGGFKAPSGLPPTEYFLDYENGDPGRPYLERDGKVYTFENAPRI